MIVEGAIVLDNNDDPNPVPGTIRWSGTDFEGFDGTSWLSLTCCNIAPPTTVTDQDGNIIPVANIGTQCWMTENLRVTNYNDGTAIPFASGAAWAANNALPTPTDAYCWPLDNQALAVPHGALYNYYVVDPTTNGGKNVCPVGWHIPTEADIATLLQFLDANALQNSSQVAGGMLKDTGDTTAGTGDWASPNTGATNSSGFTGTPSIRRGGGNFVGSSTDLELKFWISGSTSPTTGKTIRLEYDTTVASTVGYSKIFGNSCRCLKD